jgi:hypothetical protein
MTAMDRPKNQQEILEKRREIEQELSGILKETGSDFTLEDVREAIYEEEEADDFTDLIAMFDTGQGAAELQTVTELLSDAWNYFPHKILGGKSPAEML